MNQEIAAISGICERFSGNGFRNMVFGRAQFLVLPSGIQIDQFTERQRRLNLLKNLPQGVVHGVGSSWNARHGRLFKKVIKKLDK
jgi:hypothetical protein